MTKQLKSKFIATCRYRNADTGRSICAAVLVDDPDTIRYAFDLVHKDQIVLGEDDFFNSIVSKLDRHVPFTIKSQSFLMNRAAQLCNERTTNAREVQNGLSD